MYAGLYASFVSSYVGYFGRNRAHSVATGIMASLLCLNALTVVALLSDNRVPWAMAFFESLRNKTLAVLIYIAVLLVHQALSRRYRRNEGSSATEAKGQRVSPWPAHIYLWGTILVVCYVSKRIG